MKKLRTIEQQIYTLRWLEIITLIVPSYKLKHLPPTLVTTLERAHDIALKEGLRCVYLSNMPGHRATSAYCPKCKKAVIERVGFKVLSSQIRQGGCSYCGCSIPGIDLG